MLTKLAGALVDFFYPPACAACGNAVDESGTLCEECRGKLTFARNYHAEMVGLEYLDEVLVMAHYRSGFQELLQRVKFDGQRRLLEVLAGEFCLLWDGYGREMFEKLLASYARAGRDVCIIPVPTDAERFKQRGYDLPESIFAGWCAREGYVFQRCLERVRPTRPQYELDGKERKSNMVGAVKAKELPREEVLVIVDDILTTGATLCECARALRAAGGGRKIIVALALCSDMRTNL